MRKLIYLLLIVVFFLVGLSFFMQNQQVVELNYYGLDKPFAFPLALLLILVFFFGAIAGYLTSLVNAIKLRTNLAKANRTIRKMEDGQTV